MAKPRLSKSGVSWTDYSWGVIDGCTKVSEACKNCYAEGMAQRFWAARPFSEVQMHPERLEAPLNTGKGRVFVAPMGDLFNEKVGFQFIDQVFAVMALCPQHTFQVLTKRPERMLEYFSFKHRDVKILTEMQMITAELDDIKDEEIIGKNNVEELRLLTRGLPFRNVWLGVTAENQQRADERIPVLLKVPATVHFVSVEPMLGPVDLTKIKWAKIPVNPENYDGMNIPVPNEMWSLNNILTSRPADEWNLAKVGLDWVICGGESGPHARPTHPDWARSLRDQCTAAGVPFYFKQWGEWIPWDQISLSSIHDELRKALNKTLPITIIDNEIGPHTMPNQVKVSKVGTKKAGNLLDGQTWQQMPEVA
ncbi:MAG: phage Gp37/Gp68 family protein [Acidobacteriota bacterium]